MSARQAFRRCTGMAQVLGISLILIGSSAGSAAQQGVAATDPAPTLSAERIAEIVASPDRSEADRVNDKRRMPVRMLAFIGVRPGMAVLDLSAGGAVAAGILNDGVNDFLVVDWEDAPAWGTTNSNSFQIWIQLGSTEGIWYAHGGLDGPSDALSIGAENRDGSSGVNLVGAPVASDYVVKTSPPLPGGTVTITYKATVSRHGTYAIPASMTSDLVRGTAIRTVVLSVH